MSDPIRTKSLINVNNVTELIDLNGETKNFSIEFNIKSTDNKPFEVVVAN